MYDKGAVKRVFAVGDWTMRYYPPAKKCKLDSPWLGPYLVVSLAGWAVGVQLHPDSPVLMIHCQDLKIIPRPRGLVSWFSIVHAFNYRITVLRDRAKPALRIGHSRRAERRFLEDVFIPWDKQVAVMFQILSALVLDVPEA